MTGSPGPGIAVLEIEIMSDHKEEAACAIAAREGH